MPFIPQVEKKEVWKTILFCLCQTDWALILSVRMEGLWMCVGLLLSHTSFMWAQGRCWGGTVVLSRLRVCYWAWHTGPQFAQVHLTKLRGAIAACCKCVRHGLTSGEEDGSWEVSCSTYRKTWPGKHGQPQPLLAARCPAAQALCCQS